eukprot:TRINITY_DN2139_c0_g2_i1.p1 TRINITY_DN2139_c0_g2~~TRINITY_DN2139_c0_g2_i1.p1  ORF type:complete len:544 (-),score=149.51 TRINITY_DN2139_c0_g2_i1:49-1680(-)
MLSCCVIGRGITDGADQALAHQHLEDSINMKENNNDNFEQQHYPHQQENDEQQIQRPPKKKIALGLDEEQEMYRRPVSPSSSASKRDSLMEKMKSTGGSLKRALSFKKQPPSQLDDMMRNSNELQAVVRPEATGRGFLCVLVNSRSGSGDGARVLREITTMESDPSIRTRDGIDLELRGIDLSQPLEVVLDQLKGFTSRKQEYDVFKLIAAGGDGTIKWVCDLLQDHLGFTTENMPPVGVLPLGTGNELGRCIGWGAGLSMKDFGSVIQNIAEGPEVMLDRWTMRFKDTATGIEEEKGMVALFSLGFDAKITHNFHTFRETTPKATGSRNANKFWYFVFGVQELVTPKSLVLRDVIKVKVDGDDVELDEKAQSLQLMNIHSSGDGTDFWGTEYSSDAHDLVDDATKFTPSLNDGVLEMCSTNGPIHVITIKTGFSHSRRLAQTHGHRIEITTTEPLPMQIDGEPWILNPATIQVRYAGQIKMVRGPGATRNVVPSVSPQFIEHFSPMTPKAELLKSADEEEDQHIPVTELEEKSEHKYEDYEH